MATAYWQQNPAIVRLIQQSPHQFDFFEAVRLIELHVIEANHDPRNDRRHFVGEDGLPHEESLRFTVIPSLAFQTTEIARVHQPVSRKQQFQQPLEMQVTFMGLTGPGGVLPLPYTEELMRRLHLKDPTLKVFFDLFNHRLISLYYRAWEKNRFYISYEKTKRAEPKKRDLFSQVIACLTGVGTKGLANRLSVPDETLFYYAGLFAQHPRSLSGLENLLQDFFKIELTVLPFQGEWVNFAAWELTRFPSAEQPEGSYNQLGLNTMLGERVWHCQRQFRVEIGIEQAEDMLRFLPDGEDYQPLCELVRMYVGIELRFDIGFRVPTVVIPECQLTLDQPMPPRLGWNSWLGQPVGKMVVNDVHFPALD